LAQAREGWHYTPVRLDSREAQRIAVMASHAHVAGAGQASSVTGVVGRGWTRVAPNRETPEPQWRTGEVRRAPRPGPRRSSPRCARNELAPADDASAIPPYAQRGEVPGEAEGQGNATVLMTLRRRKTAPHPALRAGRE